MYDFAGGYCAEAILTIHWGAIGGCIVAGLVIFIIVEGSHNLWVQRQKVKVTSLLLYLIAVVDIYLAGVRTYDTGLRPLWRMLAVKMRRQSDSSTDTTAIISLCDLLTYGGAVFDGHFAVDIAAKLVDATSCRLHA
jgi:hypothetical protein